MHPLIKIIIYILAGLAVMFVGFWAIILTGFAGFAEFYIIQIPVVGILFMIWLALLLFGKFRGKIMGIFILGLIVATIVSSVIYHMYRDYKSNIPVMEEQIYNLDFYRPFSGQGNIAELNEPSTLQLSDSLPVIDGATALYPLYAAFVEATYPESTESGVDYDPDYGTVRGGRTPVAYERLVNGEVDVIFCARPSQEQRLAADATGKELHMTAIGKEAFVFFVNAQNPVNGLTSQQIRDIYTGNITNWREVGGRNNSIRAYQRDEGSGSQTMLVHIMDSLPLKQPEEREYTGGMGAMISRTAAYKNYKGAIGFSFLFFTTQMVGDQQIKLLQINGVSPTKETINNGTYPFTGDFYAITLGEPKPNVKKLIDWILSTQGQYLVDKTGYVPVNSGY